MESLVIFHLLTFEMLQQLSVFILGSYVSRLNQIIRIGHCSLQYSGVGGSVACFTIEDTGI